MRAALYLLALLQCAWITTAVLNDLRVVYQWKEIDYDWPDNETKALFPQYKQDDNLPLGLEVAGNRLFVTVPRWKIGAAASLNFIYLNDTRESPPLMPYPSWEAHSMAHGIPEIVSTFRVRADRCDRLWVLDTGLTDILGSPEQLAPPALLVYDLMSDKLLRKFVIPEEQRTADSLFANIAVEDYSCEDAYGYLGDLGGPGLVVYSWKMNRSWLVKHPSFHPDPQGGDFKVSGISFQWTDGLFGMALAPMGDGYSTLYYHALSSTMEYSVSTHLLRDPQRVNSSEAAAEFHTLGSRGKNGQSSVSFLDPETGVLFYALTNLNAIACWKPHEMFTTREQDFVYVDSVTMVFPNDLKVDRSGNIWVLSDRLPTFMYKQLDLNDYNFRIFSGPAKQAINGTVCNLDHQSTTHHPDHHSRSPDVNTIASRVGAPDSSASQGAASSLLSALAIIVLKIFH